MILLSLEAQETMQDHDFYLSPFGIEPKTATHKKIYKNFIKKINNFKWLDNINYNEYYVKNTKWLNIKTNLLNKHYAIHEKSI